MNHYNLDGPLQVVFISLKKEHQTETLKYVFTKDGIGNSFYNFHWSMIHTYDTILYKPYMKRLTNNRMPSWQRFKKQNNHTINM